jgi:glycosyltransferase involved in cell wall biosynthesis
MKSDVVLIQLSDFGLGRGLYLAKALSLLRSEVAIITNKPIYVSGQHPSKVMLDSNVKVIEFRIPFAKTLYSSILGRLIVYVIFGIFSFGWLLAEKSNPKMLYSRGPHPFTEIACILYKRFKRDVKIISDVTDLWPDTLEYMNFNGLLKRVLIATGHAINHLVYAEVDAIITLNEIMAKVLRYRIKRDVHVIYGSIDLDIFRPINKKDAAEALPQKFSGLVEGKFVVLYAGIMGAFQNPLIVADIAEQMQNEHLDVIFLVLGSGPMKQELQKAVRDRFLKNVLIFDAVPHELMPFVYNLADLTLLPPPVLSVPGMYEYFVLALPKKFIEYAACGKPILCFTPPCVSSELCLRWKAGYHILPKDIAKLREIIMVLKENEELRKQLGRNARRMAEEIFSTQHIANILKEISL